MVQYIELPRQSSITLLRMLMSIGWSGIGSPCIGHETYLLSKNVDPGEWLSGHSSVDRGVELLKRLKVDLAGIVRSTGE